MKIGLLLFREGVSPNTGADEDTKYHVSVQVQVQVTYPDPGCRASKGNVCGGVAHAIPVHEMHADALTRGMTVAACSTNSVLPILILILILSRQTSQRRDKGVVRMVGVRGRGRGCASKGRTRALLTWLCCGGQIRCGFEGSTGHSGYKSCTRDTACRNKGGERFGRLVIADDFC
jgi:hypothetical protein